MPTERKPTSYRYQQTLAPLVTRMEHPALRKRLSEVLTLLDFNSTLNRSMELSHILDLVLFVSMGETRASWAGILLRDDERLRPAARRGASDAAWQGLALPIPDEMDEAWTRDVMRQTKARLVMPLSKSDRLVGLLLLGERAEPYGDEETMFAEALCVSAAASIDNGRIYEELRELNQRLSFKVYQLNSLFDITRELNRSPDASRVYEVLLTSAMGHVLTTRALVLEKGSVVVERGVPLEPEGRRELERVSAYCGSLSEDRRVESLDDESMRSLLASLGIDLVVPLRSGDISHGALLLGPRASGKPPGDEDREFLRALASQAASALDNLRLTREWIEKQKIEKEMALAREIQRGLLPEGEPDISGWDIAAINIPCLTVGGDYFDYLKREGSKHWLVIADVSGKGTGAALLMASVHAALHALAGIGDLTLDALSVRLNEIVYENTELNRYVTAFFASLDATTGELNFINAGHCYPLLVREGGEVERLVEGAPVIGLLPEIRTRQGRVFLEPGDLVVMFTDGLSETRSPDGEEFEDERIIDLATRLRGRPSREIVAQLVSRVRVFAADAGLADDLTLMVVQRN
ncbi:MAG TPA: SpoIIE family protein phosphatase [Vicinamibacteria bacterium]|nr:SpoIIE family protein phosphatase [Vicinamibacteria bacterium]